MYSVITSEMRLYDGNWWQPVVIFRQLMMRASVRGNRSKQLIYMVRHNSPSSVSSSESVSLCFLALVCLVAKECTREEREAFECRADTFQRCERHYHDPYFLMNALKQVMSEACVLKDSCFQITLFLLCDAGSESKKDGIVHLMETICLY